MPTEPTPDPASADELVEIFKRAADGVPVPTAQLVAGGLERGRARRRRRTALAGAVAALALSTAGAMVVNGLSNPPITTSRALDLAAQSSPQSSQTTPARLDKAVNVLLIGLDSRKDLAGNELPEQFVRDQLRAGSSADGGYNTDTLLLLHIPADGGQVSGVSIPRDDYVQTYGVDGTNGAAAGPMDKISFTYGMAMAATQAKLAGRGLSASQLEQQGREAGRAATLATVQNLLGVQIDHFAEVDLASFYDIAQTIGPVQVCLKHAVSDPVRQGAGSGADFPAGVSSLNAADALAFVRQRHNLPNGDLDRIKRQQAFLAAVRTKLAKAGVLADLGKLQGLLGAVQKDVVIDDRWSVLDFLRQVPNLTGGEVRYSTLPIDGYETTKGMEVNLVDPAKAKALVQTLFTPQQAAAGAGPTDPGGGGGTGAPTGQADTTPQAGSLACVD
ncbi:LCP family protein [Kitasatospora kifunensis]|uniref:LCP family protein required for cell wall assembly n=1 Tax=Kitasatospora kifunensis TaxID=58351 RepID=A0A7W7R9E1_KITKI|nr:LCP family protein [Kitasatospora kifunensis]MBB4927221.1 LCP family protein required for cell wall assembly [Kitasatospora kifunensis]